MWHVCDIYIIFMWHLCDICVTFMWHLYYNIYVTFLWHFCDIYCISNFIHRWFLPCFLQKNGNASHLSSAICLASQRLRCWVKSWRGQRVLLIAAGYKSYITLITSLKKKSSTSAASPPYRKIQHVATRMSLSWCYTQQCGVFRYAADHFHAFWSRAIPISEWPFGNAA